MQTQSFAAPATAQPYRRSAATSFLRHYGEMVLAMLGGMGVLYPVLALTGAEMSDGPELYLLAMATAMTAPMVAWMRYRGHTWERGLEMAGAMFAPTFLAIGLLWGGVGDEHGALMVQHTVMFPAMFGVMLLRRDEYTGHAAQPA